MTQSQIAKIYNNSEVNEDGIMIHNFSIITVDDKRLYCKENLNPIPKPGDWIGYDIESTKTSKQGNKYSNIVKLIVRDGDINQQSQPVNEAINNEVQRQKITDPNLNIFVTGVVGRSMGGGRFTKEEIPALVSIAVRAYNDHIK
tara:strand:+ start:151 stop:582 length:432 start_codon:yes stop_codon:yes gene_type:complete